MDWYKIGNGLVKDWLRVGDGLAMNWRWLGGLAVDWQIGNNGLADLQWIGDGFAVWQWIGGFAVDW